MRKSKKELLHLTCVTDPKISSALMKTSAINDKEWQTKSLFKDLKLEMEMNKQGATMVFFPPLFSNSILNTWIKAIAVLSGQKNI